METLYFRILSADYLDPTLCVLSPHVRLSRLKGELLDARKKSGLDSKEYVSALASVLVDFYMLIDQPIIDKTPGVEYSRTITSVVVSNIRILFSSSSCNGSYSVR